VLKSSANNKRCRFLVGTISGEVEKEVGMSTGERTHRENQPKWALGSESQDGDVPSLASYTNLGSESLPEVQLGKTQKRPSKAD